MTKSLFNKDTLPGWIITALGVVGIVLEASTFYPMLPPYVAQAIQILSFLITTMGLCEVMLQSKASIAKMIIDLKSKTFWGILFTAILALTANPEQFTDPNVVLVLTILGAIMTAIGFKDAFTRGKLRQK